VRKALIWCCRSCADARENHDDPSRFTDCRPRPDEQSLHRGPVRGANERRRLERAHLLAARLQAGYVNINGFSNMEPAAPFGGYKQSGFGRFGGLTGLHEYLQTKTVFIALGRVAD
jgi:Aldehyde dehydrogenase family